MLALNPLLLDLERIDLQGLLVLAVTLFVSRNRHLRTPHRNGRVVVDPESIVILLVDEKYIRPFTHEMDELIALFLRKVIHRLQTGPDIVGLVPIVEWMVFDDGELG